MPKEQGPMSALVLARLSLFDIHATATGGAAASRTAPAAHVPPSNGSAHSRSALRVIGRRPRGRNVYPVDSSFCR